MACEANMTKSSQKYEFKLSDAFVRLPLDQSLSSIRHQIYLNSNLHIQFLEKPCIYSNFHHLLQLLV